MKLQTPLTVVCVLRSRGGEFTPNHVWELMKGVEKHWPADRVLLRAVLTDTEVGIPGVEDIMLRHNWTGWWSKMELFRPDLAGRLGNILFFDLDTLIVGDLTDIAQIQTLTALSDFYRPDRLASGMMYLPIHSGINVWEKWMCDPDGHRRRNRGDQEFLGPILSDTAERWQTLLPGQIVSYKVHVKRRGGIPRGTRVICFHGVPRPWTIRTPQWVKD